MSTLIKTYDKPVAVHQFDDKIVIVGREGLVVSLMLPRVGEKDAAR